MQEAHFRGNPFFETSRVVAVAEVHGGRRSRKEERKVIRKFGNRAVYLFEGVDSGVPLSWLKTSFHQRTIFPFRANIMGWDNQSLSKHTARLMQQIDKIITAHPHIETMLHTGNVAIQLSPQDIQASQRIQALAFEVATMAEHRNVSLISTLHAAAEQYPDKKIVIFAGKKHVLDVPEVEEALAQYLYTIVVPPDKNTSQQGLQHLRRFRNLDL